MKPIDINTNLAFFLELKKVFTFNRDKNIFNHSLLDTKIDIFHDLETGISYNTTTNTFECLNIIAGEYSETSILIIIFHDFNSGKEYGNKERLNDIQKIINYIQDNFPNYKYIGFCMVQYISMMQKINTSVQKNKEQVEINSTSKIIKLHNTHIKLNTIMSNKLIFKRDNNKFVLQKV